MTSQYFTTWVYCSVFTWLLTIGHLGSSKLKTAVTQVALVVKNLPANAGDIRDAGSIPRLGRSPGEGHGNPFQYSCLEIPMDREAWWAIVHRVRVEHN